MAVLDQHFGGGSGGTSTTVGNTAAADSGPWTRAAVAPGGQRVLRIAFLECEDLGEYLSPACFANYGGYYKMNCGAHHPATVW
jgi:hypothetical protein